MEDSGVKRRALDCAICLSQLLGGTIETRVIIGKFLRSKANENKRAKDKRAEDKGAGADVQFQRNLLFVE